MERPTTTTATAAKNNQVIEKNSRGIIMYIFVIIKGKTWNGRNHK